MKRDDLTTGKRELRVQSQTMELRAAAADAPAVISGYAAVFYDPMTAGTEYELWSDCVERLMPGCFDSALARPDDVRCLFNHNPNQPLGRRIDANSQTLKLSVDKRGLKYECLLPASAALVAEAIQRGDVTGCSFSFNVLSQVWRETKDADGDMLCIREITDLELFDVGPVTFPAYEATDVCMAKRSLTEWRETRPKTRLQRALRRLRATP